MRSSGGSGPRGSPSRGLSESDGRSRGLEAKGRASGGDVVAPEPCVLGVLAATLIVLLGTPLLAGGGSRVSHFVMTRERHVSESDERFPRRHRGRSPKCGRSPIRGGPRICFSTRCVGRGVRLSALLGPRVRGRQPTADERYEPEIVQPTGDGDHVGDQVCRKHHVEHRSEQHELQRNARLPALQEPKESQESRYASTSHRQIA